MTAALIYPHQLHPKHPALAGAEQVFLIEDPLFFSQYRFHAWKLVLHRTTMRDFERRLLDKGYLVHYLRSEMLRDTTEIGRILKGVGVTKVQFVEPNDDWLRQRLLRGLPQHGIDHRELADPDFLTPHDIFDEFHQRRNGKWFFTDFYIEQRKRLGILLDKTGKPLGGKWTFDTENRKKLPTGLTVPTPTWPKRSSATQRVITEVSRDFPDAYGDPLEFCYPTTTSEARRMLDEFLDVRFQNFGIYEDAIDPAQTFLFHSVLTPALNIGLISPREVVERALERAESIPINSLEGFIRQVIGWREYMRGVYHRWGRKQRSTNFWQHRHPMPKAFYDATTGIEPVDVVIRRVLRYAYCHHIERLMVLGNFMLLCEIDPDEVYRWFMELFIDAYDWVMVPNVYGMSQFADGGLITTKPYISGSAYISRMSGFKKGPWCPIWDALYWRFIDRHRDFFAANPRMSIMVKQCDHLGPKLAQHHRTAEEFLEQLHAGET